MSLFAQIDNAIKEAMRAKATEQLSVLRMLKSAVKYAAIEKGGQNATLTDEETIQVIRREIKKRQDSVASYDQAGRADLSAKESAEIAILKAYLPQELAAEEVQSLVRQAIAEVGATSKAQMGAVMKLVTERAAGRADGRTLSAEVQKQLS